VKVFTIIQAAKILGTSESKIRFLVNKTDTLPSVKVRNTRYITEEDIKRYIDTHGYPKARDHRRQWCKYA